MSGKEPPLVSPIHIDFMNVCDAIIGITEELIIAMRGGEDRRTALLRIFRKKFPSKRLTKVARSVLATLADGGFDEVAELYPLVNSK